MVEFKLAIGDSASKRTYKAEIKSPDADKLVGQKLGDKFKGELLGLAGYELEITGGSDKSGFPMRKDVEGQARKRIILTGGVGFHSYKKGLRRKKSIRGNTISSDIAQVNCKVIKAGSRKLNEIFGIEEKPIEKAKEEESKAKEKAKKEKKPEADGKKTEAPEELKDEKKEKEVKEVK